MSDDKSLSGPPTEHILQFYHLLLRSILPIVHLWDCRSLEMNGGGTCDCKLRGEIHSHRLIELLWND